MLSKRSFMIGENICILEANPSSSNELPYFKSLDQFLQIMENEFHRNNNEKWYFILHSKDVNRKDSFRYENISTDTEVILYDSTSGHLHELFNRKVSNPIEVEEVIESFFLFQHFFYNEFTKWEARLRDNQDNENISALIGEFKDVVFTKANEVGNRYLIAWFKNAIDREECSNAETLSNTIYDLCEQNLYGYE